MRTWPSKGMTEKPGTSLHTNCGRLVALSFCHQGFPGRFAAFWSFLLLSFFFFFSRAQKCHWQQLTQLAPSQWMTKKVQDPPRANCIPLAHVFFLSPDDFREYCRNIRHKSDNGLLFTLTRARLCENIRPRQRSWNSLSRAPTPICFLLPLH